MQGVAPEEEAASSVAGCTTNAKAEQEVCTEQHGLCYVPGSTTHVGARIGSAPITVQIISALLEIGANGLCSAPGCTYMAHARGVCQKHGANGICSVEGCTTGNAPAGDVCFKHSAGGPANGFCSTRGCTIYAQTGGACCKHGANGLWSAPLLTNHGARAGVLTGAGVGELMPSHLAWLAGTGTGADEFMPPCTPPPNILHNVKACSVNDCTNKVVARGLCKKHGGKLCSFEGCATKAYTQGVCYKHGANGKCAKVVKVGCSTPSAFEIEEAREYARSTATAAVQHAKLSMETDRLAVETQIAAKKEAAAIEAAVERRKATYVKDDKKTYYTAEVLGLAKRDRDVLMAKMMMTEIEKVELIQAVRRFKQLASQKRYLAKVKVKEMAKAAANAAEISGCSSTAATTANL